MTRKTKINKRELAAVLRESIFAPNKPGPLKVIIDVGDTRYYSQRALELITLSLESPTEEQCAYYLEQAITLLAVAKFLIRSKDNMKGKLTQKQVNTVMDKRMDKIMEEKTNGVITTHTDESIRVAGDPKEEQRGISTSKISDVRH